MTVEITTLDNGLRVASETMDHLETVAVGVWVDAGARHEAEAVNGVSHMLEHMAFKGTTRRSAQRIAEEIEAVGGHLNAYTSREQTAYYARVLAGDLPLAVDLLGDILQHSVFEPTELERERAVIIQEIGEAHDVPDDHLFDLLQEVAYPDQPMGRAILGTAERVRGFSRDTLAGYMAEHYHAPSMVLVAAGKLEHAAFVALAADAFGGLGRQPSGDCLPGTFGGGERRAARELEQVHLALGFKGVSFADDDFYAAQVLSTVLGGGMSLRLFQEIREKRGLAYSVYSFSSSFRDAGLFGVYAGTGPQQIGELAPVLADEMMRLGEDVRPDEVARAGAQLKAGMLMALESPASRCEQLARQLLIFGRPLTPAELIEKIDAVDRAAVCAVARRICRSGAPALAGLGPADSLGPAGGLEDYDVLAARFR